MLGIDDLIDPKNIFLDQEGKLVFADSDGLSTPGLPEEIFDEKNVDLLSLIKSNIGFLQEFVSGKDYQDAKKLKLVFLKEAFGLKSEIYQKTKEGFEAIDREFVGKQSDQVDISNIISDKYYDLIDAFAWKGDQDAARALLNCKFTDESAIDTDDSRVKLLRDNGVEYELLTNSPIGIALAVKISDLQKVTPQTKIFSAQEIEEMRSKHKKESSVKESESSQLAINLDIAKTRSIPKSNPKDASVKKLEKERGSSRTEL